MQNLFLKHGQNFPKEGAGKNQSVILILFAVSLLFFILIQIFPMKKADLLKNEMILASKIMKEALVDLGECQRERGHSSDRKGDINQTGLIGLEFSSITTSVGSLESKRTTTNPNFAGLIVFLLREAGVKNGDIIAVGASGSFPALILAVFSAARAMDLQPLMMCSLGASQWGANDPNFHLLHMLDCLSMSGEFDFKPIALSLGGERDTGEDMDPDGRSFLLREMKESGILYFHEKDFKINVEAKMNLYAEKAGEKKIRAFVNIGGSWSNIGIDPEILTLKPGLTKIRRLPPVGRRGILYEMAARKIPVVHLLYMKGLVELYGLPWDPVPLPLPGDGNIYKFIREKQASFLYLTVLYLLLVVIILSFKNRINNSSVGP